MCARRPSAPLHDAKGSQPHSFSAWLTPAPLSDDAEFLRLQRFPPLFVSGSACTASQSASSPMLASSTCENSAAS